jgi:hypothetical protein
LYLMRLWCAQNRYKANWPERYWGQRKQGPEASQVGGLERCTGQISEAVRWLQEPSAGADAKDAKAWALAAARVAAMEEARL